MFSYDAESDSDLSMMDDMSADGFSDSETSSSSVYMVKASPQSTRHKKLNNTQYRSFEPSIGQII